MGTTVYPKQQRRPKKRINFGRIAVYIILILGSIVALMPFLWMILASFKTGAEVRQIPPTFWPVEPTLENYITIFTDPKLPLALFYRNSALIAIVNTATALFTSSLFGYIFAKFKFPGSRFWFWIVLALMMIPFQVTMIPSYLILAKLGLLNKLTGLMIGAAITPFGIFLMRQFSMSIPNEMLDAARVDGASEWRIYWSIVLPQLGPALATLGMLTFMFNWNAYLWPLIVLTEQSKRTLPIILTWYTTQHSNQTQLSMAATVLVILPILVVFLISQRWIVRGITLSGLKG
jgi:multiple sugar transport system permease protein